MVIHKIKISISFLLIVFLTIGSKTLPKQESIYGNIADDITLELSYKGKDTGHFYYTFRNNTNEELVLNTASVGNETFFYLSIFDELDREVIIPCNKYKINYREIFEKKSNYLILPPSGSKKKSYKTIGCLKSKSEILSFSLNAGKYKAVLEYEISLIRTVDNIRNPLYQELWRGELNTDTTYFTVE